MAVSADVLLSQQIALSSASIALHYQISVSHIMSVDGAGNSKLISPENLHTIAFLYSLTLDELGQLAS